MSEAVSRCDCQLVVKLGSKAVSEMKQKVLEMKQAVANLRTDVAAYLTKSLEIL